MHGIKPTRANLAEFTVIWVNKSEYSWEYLNCIAEDSDHAQRICERLYEDADVIWVNQGHDNLSMNFH